MTTMLSADVRVSELMDRVMIVPRRIDDEHAVMGALRDGFPGVKLRRLTEGVSVDASDAERLLNSPCGLELCWSPEARLVAENRRSAKASYPEVYRRVREIVDGGRTCAERYLADVSGLKRLDDHQWVNVAAMTVPDGFGLCVFDEQGAGKTVTAIHAFDVLVGRDQVDIALIVAPKSMVPEWPEDFKRFKGDLYKVGIVAGSRKEKTAAIRAGGDVLVTNFETVIACEDEFRALLRRHRGRAILIVDESFLVKNLDAQRTRSLRRLREWCSRAFVLCGTPAPNAAEDLIQQFTLVDFGMTFAPLKMPDDPEQIAPAIKDAVERRGLFVRHLKRDVLPDLPGKVFQRVMLPLQPEQGRLYAEALSGLRADLRAVSNQQFEKEKVSYLARRSRLLEICSNPIVSSPGYRETPTKLLALDSILDEVIARRGEKVVLWSFYTASIQALFGRYSHLGAVRYDGTVDDIQERRESVRRFQQDDDVKLFIANPAAAGAGITLHRANVAIYESMSNQAAHYLQSLDRIHRRGQTREVEYLILLCDRTIEINEYERLTHKERMAQDLLGDPIEAKITRDTLLAELETGA